MTHCRKIFSAGKINSQKTHRRRPSTMPASSHEYNGNERISWRVYEGDPWWIACTKHYAFDVKGRLRERLRKKWCPRVFWSTATHVAKARFVVKFVTPFNRTKHLSWRMSLGSYEFKRMS